MPDPLTTPDPYPAVPALTAQELEEWRWYISPSVQTAEDRSRAECDRQPNIVACLRDHRGCRRARPEVVLVEGRAQNDYDHLFDARVYSPNNRMRGTWDFDAEEIARENAFPVEEDIQPPPGQRPGVDFIPPRTPTPPPEEDSLEAMMYSSIASPRPDSRNVLIFMNNAIRNNIGIRRHEIRDFAFRFRRLPAELRPLVIIERQRDDIFWMDALERVEDQVWWYNLTPTQRQSVHEGEACVPLCERPHREPREGRHSSRRSLPISCHRALDGNRRQRRGLLIRDIHDHGQ